MVRTVVITGRAVANLLSQIRGVRVAFVKVLKEKFIDYNLTVSIGGQISFDIFPIDGIRPIPCDKSRMRASRRTISLVKR